MDNQYLHKSQEKNRLVWYPIVVTTDDGADARGEA